jgi:hypothetical protein
VPRSASRQEKQRIFFTDRIRLFNFVEQLASVLELRLELGADFRANRVTATVNPGADCCPEIARRGPEPSMHLAHAFLYDAYQCAAPARMEYSDGATFYVHKNYGQAIGGKNREQDAGHARNQAVANEYRIRGRRFSDERFWNFVDAMNQVRVNLAYSYERPLASLAHGSEVAQKSRPILFDRGAGVLLGKAQIQTSSTVSLGEPTGPGAEAMNEPGNRLERIGLQNFVFSLAGSLERHRHILATVLAFWGAHSATNSGCDVYAGC